MLSGASRSRLLQGIRWNSIWKNGKVTSALQNSSAEASQGNFSSSNAAKSKKGIHPNEVLVKEIGRTGMGVLGHCSYPAARKIQAPSSTTSRELTCGGSQEEAFHRRRDAPRREEEKANTVRQAKSDPGNSKVPPA